MNKLLNTNIITKNCSNIMKISKKNNYTIIYTKDNRYLLKKKSLVDENNRLSLRELGYFDKLITIDSDSSNQLFLIDSNSQSTLFEELLKIHKITMNTIEIDGSVKEEKYKEIVKLLDKKFNYYYQKQINIQEKIFPSAGEYLLLLNISKIYKLLNWARYYVEKWFKIENVCFQKCLLVNKIDLNNYWEGLIVDYSESYFDYLVFELAKYYKIYFESTSLETILDNYQLFESEKYYLYVLLALVEEVVFSFDNYKDVILIRRKINYIDSLLTYFLKEDKENQETNKQKFKEENNNV